MKFDDLVSKIKKLKKDRSAIILAHNYQLPEVQDIADFLGDSLELSRIASRTDAKVIIFCGVHFMAETASILCPNKKVILPDIDAGCPMADMITAEDIKRLKDKHPDAVVVGYVNTSAEVKAELDYCCTSTNALDLVKNLKTKKEIIFVPDKYLADYVAKETGKKIISWHGFCPTHIKILKEDIIREKKLHPQAKVIVHPECIGEVIALADEVLSTSKMVKFCSQTDTREIIVATEVGLIYRLKKENPFKTFYPASERAICPNMKRITQEKVLFALEDLKPEVYVADRIRRKAKRAIEAMFKIL